jgi:undecaprenyl-diphosphatase
VTGRRAAATSFAASFVTFAALALTVPRDGGGLGWDARVAGAVDSLVPVSSEDVHADPVLLALVLAIAIPTLLFGLALLRRGRIRAAAFLAAAVGAAVLLAAVAKALVARPAIEGPATDHSFPSGTATLTAAIVVAVVLLAPPGRLRALLALVGAAFLLVHGGAIVFEEWHYPSDVLAGWSLALASASAAWLAFGRRPA